MTKTNTDEIRREFEAVYEPLFDEYIQLKWDEECNCYDKQHVENAYQLWQAAMNTRIDRVDDGEINDNHPLIKKFQEQLFQQFGGKAKHPLAYRLVLMAQDHYLEQPQPRETGVGELDVEKLIAHITNEFINRQFDSESVIDVSTAVDIVKTKLRKIKQTPQAQPDIGKKVILEERAALLDTKLNPNNALTPIGEAMLELCRKLLDKIEEQALNGSKEVG